MLEFWVNSKKDWELILFLEIANKSRFYIFLVSFSLIIRKNKGFLFFYEKVAEILCFSFVDLKT